MKKKIIRLGCMILAIIVMLCPLSVCFATDSTPTPTSPAIETVNNLAKEVIYYYIWIYLKSVGINIEYQDIEIFSGKINDWLEEELLEWLDTIPGIGTIDQLIFPWKFFWNPDGYLVGNQSFLDDIKDFTDWLIDIWDLDDNETNQVETSGYVIDEVVVYELPVIITRPNVLSYSWDMYNGDGYLAWVWDSSADQNSLLPRFISLSAGDITQVSHNYNNNNDYTSTFSLNAVDGTPWYTIRRTGYNRVNYQLDQFINYQDSVVLSALMNNNSVTPYGDNIYIITNTITAPTSSEADGINSIVITPSGNIYTPQDWDGTVYVDNLPAIVSTGSIPNPGFADVFLPLKAFVNTFTDGMAVIKDVVFHLPTEALAIFYAIMSITVIFGALHMFKEH